MPWRYYLDTSTFGGLVDDETPGRVEVTQALFDQMRTGQILAYTSIIALEEIAEAPESVQAQLHSALNAVQQPVLDESEVSAAFADALLERGVLTARFRDDARHLGIAVADDLDAVISWNFKHMVNPSRRRAIQAVCLMLGFRPIDIISPLEVIANES